MNELCSDSPSESHSSQRLSYVGSWGWGSTVSLLYGRERRGVGWFHDKKARTYVKTVPRSVPTTVSSSAATTEAVATRTTAAAREYLMNIKVRKGRERRRRGRVS